MLAAPIERTAGRQAPVRPGNEALWVGTEGKTLRIVQIEVGGRGMSWWGGWKGDFDLFRGGGSSGSTVGCCVRSYDLRS